MSDQIFISYRREESRWSARSLYDRLSVRFDRKHIFMDIDGIALGDDFVKAIEKSVGECDVGDDSSSRRTEGPTDVPNRSKAKRKRLLTLGLIIALIAGIDVIWSVARTTTPTPRPSLSAKNVPAAQAAFDRGFASYKNREYDKAISDFTEAIRLKPDYADPYNNRGITYDRLKNYDKAINDYTKAIRLKPDCADAYDNRAIAYAKQGSANKALDDSAKAAEREMTGQ